LRGFIIVKLYAVIILLTLKMGSVGTLSSSSGVREDLGRKQIWSILTLKYGLVLNYIYFASVWGAKYCDQRVCMFVRLSVCVFVRSRISKTMSKLHEILRTCYIPVAVARSSSDIAIRYVLPVFWMTSCFHRYRYRPLANYSPRLARWRQGRSPLSEGNSPKYDWTTCDVQTEAGHGGETGAATTSRHLMPRCRSRRSE